MTWFLIKHLPTSGSLQPVNILLRNVLSKKEPIYPQWFGWNIIQKANYCPYSWHWIESTGFILFGRANVERPRENLQKKCYRLYIHVTHTWSSRMNSRMAKHPTGRGHEWRLTPNRLEKLIPHPDCERSRSQHPWPHPTPPHLPALQEAGSSSSCNQFIHIQNLGFQLVAALKSDKQRLPGRCKRMVSPGPTCQTGFQHPPR